MHGGFLLVLSLSSLTVKATCNVTETVKRPMGAGSSHVGMKADGHCPLCMRGSNSPTSARPQVTADPDSISMAISGVRGGALLSSCPIDGVR